MSFSKSKVERFPTPNKGSGIMLHQRKRPYMYSHLSTSVPSPSLDRTPNKNDCKKKNSNKSVNASNSTGSLRKVPVDRVSAPNRCNRPRRTVATQQSTPTICGNHVNVKKNVRPREVSKNVSNPSSMNRKRLSQSNKKVHKNSHSTPKRKKFDEMQDENYSTPNFSPQLSLNETNNSFMRQDSVNDAADQGLLTPVLPDSTRHVDTPFPAAWKEATVMVINDDAADEGLLTPVALESTRRVDTPFPAASKEAATMVINDEAADEGLLTPVSLESTRHVDTPFPAAWKDATIMSMNDKAVETGHQENSQESYEFENKTVTTSGRMRRSVTRQSCTNSSIVRQRLLWSPPGPTPMEWLPTRDEQRRSSVRQLSSSEGNPPSFDLLNNSFMHLSLQDTIADAFRTPDNVMRIGPALGFGAPTISSPQSLLPFSLDNIYFPVPSTSENIPVHSPSLFDWIGNMLTAMIPHRKKLKPERMIKIKGGSSSGLNASLDTTNGQSVSIRLSPLPCQMNSPLVNSRRLNFAKDAHYQPCKEMRRLLRTLQMEARRTFGSMKISIAVPAKT